MFCKLWSLLQSFKGFFKKIYELLNPRAPKILTLYKSFSFNGHTLLGNKIVDHSDVVGASPVGAAPTTSSFFT